MPSGPKPIQDQFTHLSISRQRKYQLRKKALGLCTICGQRKALSASLCKRCLEKRGIKQLQKHKRRA